jgi:hypothetical protein
LNLTLIPDPSGLSVGVVNLNVIEVEDVVPPFATLLFAPSIAEVINGGCGGGILSSLNVTPSETAPTLPRESLALAVSVCCPSARLEMLAPVIVHEPPVAVALYDVVVAPS